MRLQTAATWEEMFLRIMQSWVDISRYIAPLDESDEVDFEDCEDCQRRGFAIFAARQDTTVERWPHWMVEELDYLELQLCHEIYDRTLYRPHEDSILRRYFLGSGNIPPRERSTEVREAMGAMDLTMKTYNLWVWDRAMNLGPWPQRVHRALSNETTYPER